MNILSLLKNRALNLLCAGLLVSMTAPAVLATELPPGVLNYLRQKDPHVKVRFDGLVLFSNGQSYVPVIPQEPAVNADSQQVVATMPAKVSYPDLIQFDNNFFLMRLIQTASGRLTFPKMADYPIQLKEGLLPQDFVMPTNLYIPVELKIILGALPYNPSFTPSQVPAVTPPAAELLKQAPVTVGPLQGPATRVTYVFDLGTQKVLAIEPITGRKQAEVALDCAPSSLRVSPDGKLLFVPCLSTNELVAIDTGSNLVKTRVTVGQRPDGVLYLDQTQDVIVSNRYSPFLTLVNSNNLTGEQKINLPGNGGAMAIVAGARVPKIVVADAFKPQIYLVDINTRAIEKTWTALPDITAIKAFQNDKGGLEIWAVSRTKDQLVVLDGATGNILKTLDVGEKPVDLAAFDGKLFVVSAGAARVDVIDRLDQSKYGTIPLEAESFPSGIVIVPSEKRAYITLAASESLLTVNLSTMQVEKKIPVEFRASMIAMTPDKAELEQNLATSPSSGLDRANKLAPKPEGVMQESIGTVLPTKEGQPDAGKALETRKSKKSKKALKPETHKLTIKKSKAPKSEAAKQEAKKEVAREKNLDASTTSAESSVEPPVRPAAMPQQPGFGSQGGGKFSLKLGRDKSKSPASVAGSSSADAQLPAHAQPTSIQVQANKNTKPLAVPLDLQIGDPTGGGASNDSVRPMQNQDDVLKN